jgi:hypothetical protein
METRGQPVTDGTHSHPGFLIEENISFVPGFLASDFPRVSRYDIQH